MKDYYDDSIYCSLMWVTLNEVQECLSRYISGKKTRLSWKLVIIIIIVCVCIIFLLLLCVGVFLDFSRSEGACNQFLRRLHMSSVRTVDDRSYELADF